jgi:hypothetical protein
MGKNIPESRVEVLIPETLNKLFNSYFAGNSTRNIKSMKPKYILFASPLILLAEIFGFSWITSLLRQKSDADVILGVVALCGLIVFNFYLIRYLSSKIK